VAAERASRTLSRLIRRETLACHVSSLTNPAFVAVPLVLGVIRQGTSSWAGVLRWGGLYLLLTDLCPMILLAVLARRGRVINLGHARRRERLRPLLISLACLSTTVVLYQCVEAPLLLRRLAWVQLVQAVLMTAVTPAWQISFHGAAAGALVTTALLFHGAGAWPLLGLPPIVGWSQVERGRHTVAQVAAGIALSVVLYGLGFGL